MTAASFAIVDLLMLGLKGLAVAGGALVGFLAGGFLVRALCRLFIFRRAPWPAVLMGRLLGALVLAGLVYLFWGFGSGGWGGLGGGGGWWPFGRPGGAGRETAPVSVPTAREQAAVRQAEPVRVIVLGGHKVVRQRFYLVEGEAQARTWPELERYLSQRRQEEPGLSVIEIILYKDSVDRDNPAVSELEDWAREHGLTPKLATPPGNSPDVLKASR